jgi:hypothetical protein
VSYAKPAACRRIDEDNMKLRARTAIALALTGMAAGTAAAQSAAPTQSPAPATQEWQYPARAGSPSPPSTLRMTETPMAPAVQPPPVRDTPHSVQLYTQCRDDADREATSAAKMREAVGRCLDELNQRRAAGQ